MSILRPKHNVDSGGWIVWRRISEQTAIDEADRIHASNPNRSVFVWRKRKATSILIYRIGVAWYLDGRTENATTPGPLAPVFTEENPFK